MERIIPNMNARLKNGGRKGMKMTVYEFVQKYKGYCQIIRDIQDYNDWWMTDEDMDQPVMYGDQYYELPVILGSKWVGDFKVKFDMENYGHEELGMTSTGIPYLATWYGGDWEEPLLVFYYFDPKGKLRNYIPTKGNTYNILTKTAFGSESESLDFETLCTKYGCNDDYELRIIALRKRGLILQPGMEDEVMRNIHYDLNACKEDFEARVV